MAMIVRRGGLIFCQPNKSTHILTSCIQKAILGIGSAATSLLDPWSSAVNGVIGAASLSCIWRQMEQGRQVARERSRIDGLAPDFRREMNIKPSTAYYTSDSHYLITISLNRSADE